MRLGFQLHFADKTVFVPEDTLVGKTDGAATVYETWVDGVQVIWKMTRLAKGLCVELSVKGSAPLHIHRIDSVVFPVGTPAGTDRIAFYGNDWLHTEARFPDELGVDREYCADCVGHFSDFTEPGTVAAGIAPFENAFGAGTLKAEDGSFTFFAKTEFTRAMAMERELHAERVFLCEQITMDELYDIYRELLPTSTFPMPKLIGWNTWDYYLNRVKPEDIEENVEALKELPFADLLQYVVIDDGWQKAWGDWRENEKFACGLRAVADKIREAGFVPGIWMAPLGVLEDSTVFKEHRDWLLRDESGQLFFDMGLYYMDPTIPEAEKYVLDNYRYQYEAGYRLYKIDYLSSLLKIRDFYDKSATAYSVLRDLMRKVQACTGPDAVILGCSLPVQCGADIAPSMRIGVDIHNHFSHVRWIAESLSWTWMYNDKVTRIDPDFMVVRGEETSTEPLQWEGGRNDFVPPPKALETDKDCMKRHWRHGDQFTALEAETWANLVAVCGGNIFLSDRMSKLNERGISIIEKALAAAGNQGRPRFLKTDLRLPSVWTNKKNLLVINWEDEACEKVVEAVEGQWQSKKPFSLENGCLKVQLKAHESFVARVCE